MTVALMSDTASEPYAQVVLVTPDYARDTLANRNERNRYLSASRVRQYAKAMADGDWSLNAETIKFDIYGQLLDGQHRLAAVVEAGVPVHMFIAVGLPPDAQDTVDRGRARQFGDDLAIKGEVNAKRLAAAVRVIYIYQRSGLVTRHSGRTQNPTPQDLQRTLDAHAGLRTSLVMFPRRMDALTNPLVVALHYLFASADRHQADEFFTQLRDGAGLTTGSPVLTLRERLRRESLDSKKANDEVLAAFTIRSWNACRRGQSLTKLQWMVSGLNASRFPRIHGCTVPVHRYVDRVAEA